MSDQLEKYIRENRHQFDDQEPTEKVWNHICHRLNMEPRPRLAWLWKAAAILFFMTSGYLLYQLEFSDSTEFARNDGTMQNEFENIESFYFQKISEKKALLTLLEDANVPLDEDFRLDLQKLDAMYEVLKEELNNNPSKKVVDALILNLLIRVDILNKALQEREDASDSTRTVERNV